MGDLLLSPGRSVTVDVWGLSIGGNAVLSTVCAAKTGPSMGCFHTCLWCPNSAKILYVNPSQTHMDTHTHKHTHAHNTPHVVKFQVKGGGMGCSSQVIQSWNLKKSACSNSQ